MSNYRLDDYMKQNMKDREKKKGVPMVDFEREDWDVFENPRKPQVPRNKDTFVQTFLHYSDADTSERTVFGAKEDKLFYNYDDRLFGKLWDEGFALAKDMGAKPKTARFFEIALSHFHGKKVDLRHIVLGCNRSSGYPYLVFGYIIGEEDHG